MTVVGIAGQGLGVEHELAGRGTGVGGDDRDLDAELVGRAGFALADALDLGGVEGIELPAALALLLGADLGGPRERFLEGCFDRFLALDLAADVTDQPAQAGAQEAQFAVVAVELFGMGVGKRWRLGAGTTMRSARMARSGRRLRLHCSLKMAHPARHHDEARKL